MTTNSSRPKIAIIGANGQVGTEVCLFLNQLPDVEVVPICRTQLGSAFLRRCGLDCRHGSISDSTQARSLLVGADVVADFSLPSGTLSQIRDTSCRNITNAVEHSEPNAAFVYISTLMALGMAGDDRMLRYRLIPRTSYASWKRRAERHGAHCAKKSKRSSYILRLGQVHGELQNVSLCIKKHLAVPNPRRLTVPDSPSFTVFTYSIAEALAGIALGKEHPGVYSLVSTPSWSWHEVLNYYMSQLPESKRSEIAYESPRAPMSLTSRLRSSAMRPISAWSNANQDLLYSYVLSRFPRLESRLRAKRNCSRAKLELQTLAQSFQDRIFGNTFSNDVPGRRLSSISDSRVTMIQDSVRVREIIACLPARELSSATRHANAVCET